MIKVFEYINNISIYLYDFDNVCIWVVVMINIDLWLLVGVICSYFFMVLMLWCFFMVYVIFEYIGSKNNVVSSVVLRKMIIKEDFE